MSLSFDDLMLYFSIAMIIKSIPDFVEWIRSFSFIGKSKSNLS